jgi:hypothetical protein
METDMKLLQELYDFYIENCVDEENGEIPLNFEEWNNNYGEEELENIKYINKQTKTK